MTVGESMHSKIRLHHRLSFRQARDTVIVTLLLGILLSGIQIGFDFFKEKKRMDSVVLQVVNMLRDSAARAVYDIDELFAKNVISGLFEYRPIRKVQIIDEFDVILQEKERWVIGNQHNRLIRMIFEPDKRYTVPLHIRGRDEQIGNIVVFVDTYLVAENFISRAGLVIISGIVRNIGLSIVLTMMFYFTLTKPLLRVVQGLSTVDIESPAAELILIPRGHNTDEFGLLIHTINTVLTGFDESLNERNQAEELIRKLNKELEERVRERTVELEAANKELEAFSYSVSHDLRAPLRALDGFSQALMEDYFDTLDEEGRDFLQRMRNASQSMGGLIDDLLNLSRVTRDEIKPKMIDLTALGWEIIEVLKSSAPDRIVDVVIEENLVVSGDLRHIRLMLTNLLGNAWKFTSKTENARIEFGMKKEGESMHFYISDNGAGFNMLYVDKLFTAFNRLHKPDDFEGSGIGLAIVQRVISRHDGRIWAEGEVEKGTVFRFTL